MINAAKSVLKIFPLSLCLSVVSVRIVLDLEYHYNNEWVLTRVV